MGFWVEIVTLVVPGFNDTDDELRSIAEFLAGVSPDIPWHVTAFHQDYKMTDPDNTPAARCARRGDRPERRAPLRLRGQPAGHGRRPGRHRLPRLRRAADRRAAATGFAGTASPPMAGVHPVTPLPGGGSGSAPSSGAGSHFSFTFRRIM